MIRDCTYILYFFLVWTLSIPCIAQKNQVFSTAYGIGIYEADRFSTDRPLFHLHPGLLPFQESMILSGSVENRFAGFDLSSIGLLWGSPLPSGFGAGLAIFSFGNEDYRYYGTQWSAGKKVSQSVSIGVSQTLERTKVINEGRPWQGNTSVSAAYVGETNGAMIYTEGLMPFGQEGATHRHWIIHLAGYHRIHSRTILYLLLKYQKENYYPAFGLKQILLKNVELFGSLQVFPARYGVGFSFPLFSALLCTASTRYHPVLGWSPAIGMQWNIRKDVQ